MRYSILFTTVLATAVAAGPIDLLNLNVDNTYPTTTTAGYPTTSYPTTTTKGYPTSSSTTTKKPSTTTTWGGNPTSSSTTTKKPSTTTTWGGNPTSSTTKPGGGSSTTTTWGGNPTSSTTKPGGGNPTTTTKPGGGNPTTTTAPGGGNPTTTTTKPGGGNPTTTTSSGGSGPTGTPYFACPDGLYSVPQCCATDVLGVADLDCHSPASVPTSASNFQAICAAGGQRARCCVIPVLGQSVLCETPAGLGEQ